VIPLLWRAQEQDGWCRKPAIEEVARMLGMAYIRVLEVATFYYMFHLTPVGRWRMSSLRHHALHAARL
jgi:NADH-quinone oxidoreductase subunit E